MTGRIILPSSRISGRTPKFQCLSLSDGAHRNGAGEGPIWPGESWTPNIGQAPTWYDSSVSLSWRILEGGVLKKYCLSPVQCSHFLRLAQQAGCPPLGEIEALFLKQGGVYPSSCLSSPSVCGKPPSGENGPSSRTALERQMALFPRF